MTTFVLWQCCVQEDEGVSTKEIRLLGWDDCTRPPLFRHRLTVFRLKCFWFRTGMARFQKLYHCSWASKTQFIARVWYHGYCSAWFSKSLLGFHKARGHWSVNVSLLARTLADLVLGFLFPLINPSLPQDSLRFFSPLASGFISLKLFGVSGCFVFRMCIVGVSSTDDSWNLSRKWFLWGVACLLCNLRFMFQVFD